MDFTLTIYKQLLSTLLVSGYSFQTLADFVQNSEDKTVVLRHDVDRLPGNALKMARLEQGMGLVASYYFRAVPVSWDEDIMRKIAEMGHEVGYHYESLSMFKGDMDKAFEDFKSNLERLREITPVRTICMHGSPLSRIDNLDLWKEYDYRELGVVAEPYLDVDYDEVFYITDTGRKWNNEGASIRDRVQSGFDIEVKSTEHLIEILERREEEICPRNTRKDTEERKNNFPGRKKNLPEKRLPLLLDSEFNFCAFPRVPWTKGFLMRHEELTYNILGACFEVYKRMGCGFLEAVYQECLEIELEYRDIPYVAQQELKLAYRDRELKQHYVPDFICYEKVIVEIKAVQEMGSDHQAQLLNYLHGTGMQVGLLANFGHYPKLEYKRMVL